MISVQASLTKPGIASRFQPSAGTHQEVFQDAAQNHYETAGLASPMLFLDTDFWRRQLPAVALLEELAEGRPYRRWIHATDSIDEIVDNILEFDRAETRS